MLILTRRAGESINILVGDTTISVLVTRINNTDGTVKLGFTAPREVIILRKEIANREHKG